LCRKGISFPEVFGGWRALGERHALVLQGAELRALIDEGAGYWGTPQAVAVAGSLPPGAEVRITGELTERGINVLHAEALPEPAPGRPSKGAGSTRRTAASEDTRPARALGDDGNLGPETTTPSDGAGHKPAGRFEERLAELARDPDHGGRATPKSRREAEVALALEAAGKLPAPVRRPARGDGHSGDLVDGRGNDWDIKSPQSREMLIERERVRLEQRGRTFVADPMRRMSGEFDVDDFFASVASDLAAHESIIIDASGLTANDLLQLKDAVTAKGLGDRFMFHD
jgi:hypothetical protein